MENDPHTTTEWRDLSDLVSRRQWNGKSEWIEDITGIAAVQEARPLPIA